MNPSVEAARVELLRRLKALGYGFVTPTPATHRRVVGRTDNALAKGLRDVFGWSLPFLTDVVPADVLALMRHAEVLQVTATGLKATVRVSSLAGELFLHSAFPTDGDDAVFFGPDTYRFARLVQAELASGPPVRALVDIGSGSGAGGILAARLTGAERLILTDVNPKAHELARANAAAAGIDAEFVLGEGLKAVDGPLDLIVTNPPFIASDDGPTYSAGGDMHGAALSLQWAREAAEKLAPGGRLILYTGSAIVGGQDAFRQALEREVVRPGLTLRYEEIDPDIFGGELGRPTYREVERIAAVAAALTRER